MGVGEASDDALMGADAISTDVEEASVDVDEVLTVVCLWMGAGGAGIRPSASSSG